MENNKQSEGLGIAGFIVSFFFPLIGLILSIIGLSNGKKNNNGVGFAIAGIVLSCILIFIRILAVLLLVFVFKMINIPGLVKDGYNEMCSKVEKCEYVAGNLYDCSYESENVKYNITCTKDRLPSNILKGDYNENEEINKTGFIEEYKKETSSIEVFANNKMNTITFEYITEPYISEEKLDEEQIEERKRTGDYIYNTTTVKVRINGKLVHGYYPIYEYNSEYNFTKTLNIENVKVLKGKDKDYFVFLIEESNYDVDGVINPFITNENGKEIKKIEFIAGAGMWVTDKDSVMYDKGSYFIDNDKLYYIGCAEGTKKNLGQDEILYQEYILTVDNDEAIVTKGMVSVGTGAGAKVC